MNKTHFSWIALGIGGLIAMILLRFGATGQTGEPELPLLTSLFLAEFGFLVTGAGAIIGIKAWLVERPGLLFLLSPVACALLALAFAWLGFAIWGEKVST